MTVDPRAALDRFVAALEAHLDAVVSRRGDDDPRVDDTYYVLGDAFEVYDDALGEAYGEATPFVLDDEDDEDDDERDDERDDEGHDDGHGDGHEGDDLRDDLHDDEGEDRDDDLDDLDLDGPLGARS